MNLQLLSLLDDEPLGQAWQTYAALEPVRENEDLIQLDSETPQEEASLPQPLLDKVKGKEPLYPAPAIGDGPDPGPSSPIGPADEGPLVEEPIHEPLSYVPAPASVSPILVFSFYLLFFSCLA